METTMYCTVLRISFHHILKNRIGISRAISQSSTNSAGSGSAIEDFLSAFSSTRFITYCEHGIRSRIPEAQLRNVVQSSIPHCQRTRRNFGPSWSCETYIVNQLRALE